ncbi:hydrogen peroxide-inducible activator [Roseibium sp. TrichSKD4]|uniref:hydrogen peroxide-inducible genes activator n=1 Tax=Roseibium sp. TrichSKD4 TaxID=744980 RepID=UPI0001E56B7C|nr:hydrogen peroxide-inducible genes activator [Roseibium sp. TrichSKD4]EFO30722.1 hydrogen peroxide-inducible activator [Roseibium sp. TrichSKD4]
MTPLTIRQLHYFDALARTGHFGQAAEACAISQPALSMQIKELESLLGAPIFERSVKKLRLTPFGEEAVERARQILKSIDELEDLARASSERLVGRLRIGVIPTIAPYLLPAVIQRLQKDHPGLDIHIRETITPTLLEELNNGKLDAAIVALPVSEAGINEVPLIDENFVLVRPEADANKPIPNPDALREMRLLLLEEGHCFRDQALAFCNFRPGTSREVLDANSLATLVQMVSAGLGVTLIPEMAVPIETQSAKVTVTSFKQPKPTRTIGMVWRNSTPLARQLEDICNATRETIELKMKELIQGK